MPLDNIYHIGTGRAGKTWIKLLFGFRLRDNIFGKCGEIQRAFQRYEKVPGLVKFTGKRQWQRSKKQIKIPPKVILVGLGCPYDDFLKARKSDNFKGIFIRRDPRQVFWSIYNAWTGAHLGGQPKGRLVKGKSLEESLRVVLNDIETRKMFEWTLTWSKCTDGRIMNRKFEDIFANDDAQDKFVKELFEFLGIAINEEQLKTITDFLRFDRITNGRKRGDVNNQHQFRSGSSGTWKERLPTVILDELQERFGHVIEGLGYEIDRT